MTRPATISCEPRATWHAHTSPHNAKRPMSATRLDARRARAARRGMAAQANSTRPGRDGSGESAAKRTGTRSSARIAMPVGPPYGQQSTLSRRIFAPSIPAECCDGGRASCFEKSGLQYGWVRFSNHALAVVFSSSL
jgi:hypothetical protein